MAACRFGPDSSLCLIGAPRRYAAPHYHARDPGPSLYNGVRMGDHTQQPGRADPRTPDGHPAARRVLVMPAQPRKDRANDAAPPKGGGLTAGPRRQPRRGRTMVLLLFVCSLSGDRHFGKKKASANGSSPRMAPYCMAGAGARSGRRCRTAGIWAEWPAASRGTGTPSWGANADLRPGLNKRGTPQKTVVGATAVRASTAVLVAAIRRRRHVYRVEYVRDPNYQNAKGS